MSQNTFALILLDSKGQLISKCLYEVIVWTKIPPKNLMISALALSGQKLSNFSDLYIGQIIDGDFAKFWGVLRMYEL